MKVSTGILAALGVVILIVAIAIGGWQLKWWLAEETTNRTTGIANESLARQQARVDETLDKAATIADIDVQISLVTPEQATVLVAQRRAVVSQFCDAYGGLTDRLTVPTSVVTLSQQEC